MKFTLATSQGTQQGSFFDLLSAVADGSLLDLPRLRPHQRGPVVTAVAQRRRTNILGTGGMRPIWGVPVPRRTENGVGDQSAGLRRRQTGHLRGVWQ
jgi:hypothetical protein